MYLFLPEPIALGAEKLRMADFHRHRIGMIEKWNRLELFQFQTDAVVRDIGTGLVPAFVLGKALIRRFACHTHIIAWLADLVIGIGFDESVLFRDTAIEVNYVDSIPRFIRIQTQPLPKGASVHGSAVSAGDQTEPVSLHAEYRILAISTPYLKGFIFLKTTHCERYLPMFPIGRDADDTGLPRFFAAELLAQFFYRIVIAFHVPR